MTFTRTGARRYSVSIDRPGQPRMVMSPAPGYHPYLPHDLVHFTVEAEAGIELGVFGQVAAGGTAGTFWPAAPGRRRKIRKLGDRLAATGRNDATLSERLAAVAIRVWEKRNGTEPTGDPLTRRIQYRLDEYAALWHALPVGGSLTLHWPAASQGSRRSQPGQQSRAAQPSHRSHRSRRTQPQQPARRKSA